jgi:hypothetical protein
MGSITAYVSNFSIATGYGRDKKGQSSSPAGVKNVLFSTSSRSDPGLTRPPFQWIPGAFTPGVKRPAHEADHSPPTSAEVKKNVDLHIHFHILHSVVLN